MRNKSVLLSILVLAAMVLAACGGGATSTNVASPPPAVTVDATDVMTEEATEAPTMEGTATGEPGVPVTGEVSPARVSNQMEFPVLSQDGEQIGQVNDLILDLDNRSVAYVIVTANAGGTVAVPWESLELQTNAGSGTGTDQSTATADAGTGTGQETATPGTDQETATPDTGTGGTGQETATADAGTGTDSGSGTGMGSTSGQQNAFVLLVDQELLTNAPAFDPTTLPEMGQSAGDWDADINTYWQGGGTGTDGTGTGTDANTPAPDGTAVPEATATSGTGTGQSTATADAGTGGTGTGQGTSGQTLQGVVLASEVLGSTVTLSPGQGDGQGQTQGQDQATADPNATVDPNATATTEGTGQGQDQGQGVGNISATIEDIIVDTDMGDIQYFVLNTTLEEGERWVPVPLGLMQWDAAGAFLLNVNPSVFRDAPFFEGNQFPDTSMEGWDSEFDSFWQNNGTGSGNNSGGSGGTDATATP